MKTENGKIVEATEGELLSLYLDRGMDDCMYFHEYVGRMRKAGCEVKGMKIGSLFDGSGGFPLAATMCGIKPVWASEVEPYPIAVTRSRFPNMKHLGSVTEVKGNEVEPVDVITFGSPCQDLSVAGKRAGLKHTENGDDETTRSGLFMEAIRIIKEMRETTNGEYPRFAVWENVPGAFSSNKGEDFRIVLEEFIKVCEPTAVMPTVPKNGWPYADSYCGDGWSLAYRVFDAQFWGVPQRRRRIYLVADFRGQCAGKVSFEREGLRGYFETGRTPWQEVAGDSESCTGTADCTGECITLEPGISAREGGHIYEGVSGTLRANMGDNQMAVAYSEMVLDDQGGSQISVRTDGKSPTLRAEMHGNVPAVMEPVAYNGENITSPLNKTNPQPGDPCHTLGTDSRNYVVIPTAYAMQSFGDYKESEVASGLKARDYKDATDLVAEVAGVDCRNATEYPEKNSTLQAKSNGGFSLNCNQVVRVRHIVRRLTPTECARLQGFPDKWGHPDIKESLTDEEYTFWLNVRNTHAEINGKAVKDYTREQMLTWYNRLHTDSSEYKMWGNGIALPCALYVMQGIYDALMEDRNVL